MPSASSSCSSCSWSDGAPGPNTAVKTNLYRTGGMWLRVFVRTSPAGRRTTVLPACRSTQARGSEDGFSLSPTKVRWVSF
eukprot:scaffold1706_cov113-Isochrysis_galbana.AAC.9